ncbi:MAG: DUF2007 domain-containing protein [Bacteroidetes bacterium]|nr:DUF2007 domain-containing protein [Bacteroidota bacterium]MDA0888119.1 DUF2007 domain-containing protein [Bacteroidota bacterium]MDA1084071.1 DUF2007 domain-containing protein [Bacteroidota bacterium]
MSDSFSLLYTGNLIDIQRLKAILEENNIFPIVKDETESARLAGFGAPTMMQQLWVLASELEKAKALL